MRYQVAIIAAMTLLLGLTQIRPLYPRDQLLHHAPLLVAIPFLLLVASKKWLSSAAMTCIVLFLVLHIVGGRYVYSAVPYEALLADLLGISLEELFGSTRNHYDRFVHLAFGFLAVLPLAEVTERHGRLSGRWSLVVAVLVVAAAGAVYEVFEWALAMAVAPEMAERYNGQQGDPWDAQKDMALAIAGSGVCSVGLCLWRLRSRAGRAIERT